nr:MULTISPECIES: GNAT family N-acetyltransferase [Myxococcaceae]
MTTERLVLRRHQLEDFEPASAMWASPDVVRHIGGRPFTKQETWFRLLRYVGHWELQGYGFWAVEERETGRFVGELGFADFQRELTPPLGAGTPEMGWALVPSAHGRGYATEALSAALAWGDAHFEVARSVCIIDPGNLASVRVAEKLGFRAYAAATLGGAPTRLFERPFVR